jgi:hypothetical protein
MFIKINENRKQSALYSEYAGKTAIKNKQAIIEVDCASPSEHHTLKTDYKDFSGVEQWEFNAAAKEAAEREAALAKNVFSKLKIRRAMRALGQEQILDDLLAENDEFKKDWNDSDEGIDLSDDSVDAAIKAKKIDVTIIKLAIAGILNTQKEV